MVIRRRNGELCGVAAIALARSVLRKMRDVASFILVVRGGIGMAIC